MKTLRTLLLLAALWGYALDTGMAKADEQPPHSGFLTDYSGFVSEPDSELEYNLVWYKPGVDPKTFLQPYSQFMLDTVTVFPHPGAEYKGLKPEELARLSEYFLNSLTKQLTDGGYQVVTEPGPEVARVRIAITDVVPVNPAMNTFSTFVPQARLLSGVVAAARLSPGEAALRVLSQSGISGDHGEARYWGIDRSAKGLGYHGSGCPAVSGDGASARVHPQAAD